MVHDPLKLDLLQRLFKGNATFLRAKGFSSFNPKRDYGVAKEPANSGWNSQNAGNLSLSEINDWVGQGGWIGLVVPIGFIVVDVDDQSEGAIMRGVLLKTNTKHAAFRTPKGYQFIFMDAFTVRSQITKALTLAGFIVDYRLPGKGYTILPIEGNTPGRDWLNLEDDVDEMPYWLTPTGKRGRERPFSLPIEDGERNDLMFRHGCRLLACGIPDDTVVRTMRFMADYLCNPPYDETEKLDNTIQSLLNYARQKKESPLRANTDFYTNILTQEGDQDEWEEPIWFTEHDLPTFPVAMFPAWIREYVEDFSTRLQVPIDAPCMAVLSILSTALAKKFVVVLPQHNWTERINLYTTTIMPPGEKKSETLRVFAAPLKSYQAREHERIKPEFDRQQAQREAKKKRLESLDKKYGNSGDPKHLEDKIALAAEMSKEQPIHLPQLFTTDCTPERLVGLMKENDERMAILSTEGGIFGTMAGRYSGGIPNLDVFLQSHTGDSLTVDRQGRKEQLVEPALTIGLFVQPDVLARLPDEMVGRGLLARFLYSLPKTKVGFRTLQSFDTDDSLKARYDANMDQLLSMKSRATALHLSAEAYAAFQTFWVRVERALKDDAELSSPAMKSWGNKLSGAVLRIAALIRVAANTPLDELPVEISEITMKFAIDAGEYFISHAKAVFDDIGLDNQVNNAKYLLHWIKKLHADPISSQELWQATKKRMKDAEQFRFALSILEDRGYVRRRRHDRKEVVYINPRLNSDHRAFSPNSPVIPCLTDLGELGNLIEPVKNELIRPVESEDLWL